MKKNFILLIFFLVPGLLKALPEESFPDEILRNAFTRSFRGDTARALELFEDYLKIQDDPYVRFQYSSVLYSAGRKEEALNQAKIARDKSKDPEISIQYIRLLIHEKKYSDAESILNEISRNGESDPVINFYRSEIFEKTGRPGEAEVACQVVLFRQDEIGWSSPYYTNVCLWRMANIYIQQQKYERAGMYLMKFLKQNPDSIFARFILGYYVYYRNGKFSKAQKEFESLSRFSDKVLKANKVDPLFMSGLLGKIYLLKNDMRCYPYMRKASAQNGKDEIFRILYKSCRMKTDGIYSQINEVYGRNPDDLFIAAVAMRLMEGRTDPESYVRELLKNSVRFGKENFHEYALDFALKALEIKKKYAEIAIPHEFIYLRISLHYAAMNEYNRSILYLRLSLNEKDAGVSGDKRAVLAQSLTHSNVRRYSEAEKISEELMAENPEDDAPYYIRGLIALDSENFEASAGHFSNAIQRDPEKADYYFYRAAALHSMGKKQEAEKDLLQLLGMNSNFPAALNFLGFMYAEEGERLNESLLLISRALDSDPLNGGYQDSLGWVYYKMGKFQEARFHLELAVQILEEEGAADPEVIGHLGDVMAELNYPKEALSLYKRAVETIEKKQESGSRGKKLTALKKEMKDKIIKLEVDGNREKKPE